MGSGGDFVCRLKDGGADRGQDGVCMEFIFPEFHVALCSLRPIFEMNYLAVFFTGFER